MYNFADLWLINTHNGIKERGINPVKINDYPAVKKHLDSFYSDLIKRVDKGDTPYNLRNCVYWEDFSKQKIVWKRVGSILRFSYDNDGAMALDSTCFATGSHIKFLVAFLNSKLGKYLLKDSPQTGTGDLLISVQAIEPLKIPKPDAKTEIKLINLVDCILQNENDRMNLIEVERKIDSIIYSLLEFDNQEIEFIEALQ